MDRAKGPCFKCGCELENLMPNDNQPNKGLEFITHGHYGSSFFDPMDGSYLRINICDLCLRENRDRIIRPA